MQRITIAIGGDLIGEVEPFVQARGYEARPEVFRDLPRAGLERVQEDSGATGGCVAALTYVYGHGMRELCQTSRFELTGFRWICHFPQAVFPHLRACRDNMRPGTHGALWGFWSTESRKSKEGKRQQRRHNCR
jgi:hypothetical protein